MIKSASFLLLAISISNNAIAYSNREQNKREAQREVKRELEKEKAKEKCRGRGENPGTFFDGNYTGDLNN